MKRLTPSNLLSCLIISTAALNSSSLMAEDTPDRKATEATEAQSLQESLLSAQQKAVRAMQVVTQPSMKSRRMQPSDPATQKLRNKQQLLSIENTLEDEKLKKQFTDLRSRLQKLSWEKEELEQQLAIEKLKKEVANSDAASQHEDNLSKLQQENDLLTEELAIAKAKYELSQRETTTKNTEALDELTAEKNQLKEKLEIETLKREDAQRELKLTHEEKLESLKRQKDLLAEELALNNLQRTKELETAKIEFDDKLITVSRAATLAEYKADNLESELSSKRSEWKMTIVKLESEIEKMEIEKKRKAYLDTQPVYLEDPLEKDGTLVISDRRIPLNGVIRRGTADYITSRISYYNNMDEKLPIFIVINSSPGGSVMEGYRILKAMEGSSAPIYVVVKSYAASMAAAITALAEKSYAYPNAIFIHHQISTSFFFTTLNLTEQKELHESSMRWWKRLAQPIANKMGITTDEFIKQMYEKSSSGDWDEFGTEAQKLKWVDTIVNQVRETSLLKDPDIDSSKFVMRMENTKDESGAPVMYLPRLSPRDHYYLYNPDNYYRMK